MSIMLLVKRRFCRLALAIALMGGWPVPASSQDSSGTLQKVGELLDSLIGRKSANKTTSDDNNKIDSGDGGQVDEDKDKVGQKALPTTPASSKDPEEDPIEAPEEQPGNHLRDQDQILPPVRDHRRTDLPPPSILRPAEGFPYLGGRSVRISIGRRSLLSMIKGAPASYANI
jgi:hypothetical protein